MKDEALFFQAVVHQADGSSFGLYFPDLPCVYSAANDIKSLTASAIEALLLYAEDSHMPDPRSITEVRLDAEVAIELARGAFLLPIPFSVIQAARHEIER